MSVTAKSLINSKFASSTGATEYRVPVSTRAIIDKFTATNTDSGAVTITVYLVPNGISQADSNQIIKALSVAAGATTDIDELKNHILEAGDTINVIVSVADKMTIRASGREVT